MKQDAKDGDQRADLEHSPSGPVDRHQVFAVAELERHKHKDFENNGDNGNECEDGAVDHASLELGVVGLASGPVACNRFHRAVRYV